MPGFFDGLTLTLTCRLCGHEAEHTVSELKARQAITCSTCGVATSYNAAEFRDGLKRAERVLDDLRKESSEPIKLGRE